MKTYKSIIISIFYLLSLLPRKFKYRSIFTILIMILSSLSEVISLSLVIPFLLILTSPNEIWNFPIIKFLSFLINVDDSSQLIFYVSLLFILSSLVSASVRIFNLFCITKLTASIGNYLAYESFRRMLYQDYTFHININTSEIISNITLNVSRTVLILNQLFLLFTSIFISTALVSSLLIVNTKITIYALFIFSFAYLLIALSTKEKLSSNSKLITKSSNLQIKFLQEGLGSIRDILINSSYRYFLDLFNKADSNLRLSLAENQVIASFPRYAIESLGIVLIVIVSMKFQADSNAINLIPLLGTLAFASQKLIPSIQQIYASFSNIRSYSSSLVSVIDLVSKPIKENQFIKASDSIIFTKEIELNNVYFKYIDSGPLILKNINFKIYKGQRIGIVGKTGSGKSTLLDILMGLLKPTEGKFLIDNKENQKEILISNWRSLISHVPQNIFLTDGTFTENIAFGVKNTNIDYERVKIVAKKACLLDLIEGTENGFETKVGERGVRLSGGQRQRIGIARALYRRSQILFLDEATSALDVNTEKELIKNINSLSDDITIIMIAHRLCTLKLCDTIYEVKNGRLLKKDYKTLSEDLNNK